MASPFTMVDVPLTPEANATIGAESIRLPAEVLFGVVFRADKSVSVMHRPDGSPLLRLGQLRLESVLCLDPVSGEVHDIQDPESASARRLPSLWLEHLTNATLESFVAIARAVSERFPFYDREPDDNEMRAADSDIRRLVSAIDPRAGVPGTFWTVLADDVGMGDFPTEDVVLPRVTLTHAD